MRATGFGGRKARRPSGDYRHPTRCDLKFTPSCSNKPLLTPGACRWLLMVSMVLPVHSSPRSTRRLPPGKQLASHRDLDRME